MGSPPTQAIPASSGRIAPGPTPGFHLDFTFQCFDKSPCRTQAFRHFTSAMQNVILAVNYLVGKDVWQVFYRAFYWFYWGFMWQGAHTTMFLLVSLVGFYCWFSCGRVPRPRSLSLSSRGWRRSLAASLAIAETGTSFSASETRSSN